MRAWCRAVARITMARYWTRTFSTLPFSSLLCPPPVFAVLPRCESVCAYSRRDGGRRASAGAVAPGSAGKSQCLIRCGATGRARLVSASAEPRNLPCSRPSLPAHHQSAKTRQKFVFNVQQHPAGWWSVLTKRQQWESLLGTEHQSPCRSAAPLPHSSTAPPRRATASPWSASGLC